MRYSPILSEWWSIWEGELDTLLLGWEEVWLPGRWLSSRERAGEGLSGIRSWHTKENVICVPNFHVVWIHNIWNVDLRLILKACVSTKARIVWQKKKEKKTYFFVLKKLMAYCEGKIRVKQWEGLVPCWIHGRGSRKCTFHFLS